MLATTSRDYSDVIKLERTSSSSVHSPVKSMTSSYTSSPAPSTSSTPDYSQQFNLDVTSQTGTNVQSPGGFPNYEDNFIYQPPTPSFDDVTMVRRNLIDGLSTNSDVIIPQQPTPRKSFENVTDKELRKKLKNRESAQAARDRKKAKMLGLERQISELLDRNRMVEAENRDLRSRIQRMEAWRKDDVTYATPPQQQQDQMMTYGMTSHGGSEVIDYSPYQQHSYSTQGSPDSTDQFFDFAPPYGQWSADDVTNDARHAFVITSPFPGEHGVAG